MEGKLAKIYHSPEGYWKGITATKKIAQASKVSENVAKRWLFKQALWQIYLPARFHTQKVHQADLLFMPHDKVPRGRKIFRYALTVVDVASCYKEVEPLSSKNSDEVANAFQTIYNLQAQLWPKMLQVDHGREFMGAVTKEMEKTQNIYPTRAR